jgi:hypothetical protein
VLRKKEPNQEDHKRKKAISFLCSVLLAWPGWWLEIYFIIIELVFGWKLHDTITPIGS